MFNGEGKELSYDLAHLSTLSRRRKFKIQFFIILCSCIVTSIACHLLSVLALDKIIYEGEYHPFIRYEEIDKKDIFEEAAQAVIPAISELINTQNEKVFHENTRLDTNRLKAQRDCITPWITFIDTELFSNTSQTFDYPNYSHVQKKIIQKIIRKLNFSPLMEETVESLAEQKILFNSSSSTSLQTFLQELKTCGFQNKQVNAMACATLDDAQLRLDFLVKNRKWKDYVFEILHFMVFLNFLSETMLEDNVLAFGIIDDLYHRNREKVMNSFDQMDDNDNAVFLKLKFYSVYYSIDQKARDQNNVNSPMSRIEQDQSNANFQMNILEATEHDYSQHFVDNSVVGLKLAAAIDQFTSVVDSKMEFPIGKKFIDHYISWNLAFVLKFNGLLGFSKLLIPTMLCPASENGKHWLIQRGYTLFVFINYVYNTPIEFPKPPIDDVDYGPGFNPIQTVNVSNLAMFGSIYGKLNFENFELSTPTPSKLKKMIETLERIFPHELSSWVMPLYIIGADNILNDNGFLIFQTFILFINVTLAGLILEYYLGPMIIEGVRWKHETLPHSIDVSDVESFQQRQHFHALKVRSFYIIVESIFGTMLTIAIFLQNLLAIPFLILGLFKFGFPEIMYYTQVSCSDGCDSYNDGFEYSKNDDNDNNDNLANNSISQEKDIVEDQKSITTFDIEDRSANELHLSNNIKTTGKPLNSCNDSRNTSHVSSLRKYLAFADSYATLLHHMTTVFLVSGLATHLVPLNAPLISCLIPLILQHFFVPVKYASFVMYSIIESLLELYFQWEVFRALSSDKENFEGTGVRGAALTMLLAHWVWIGLGFVKLVQVSPLSHILKSPLKK